MTEELLHMDITDVGGVRAVRQAGRRVADGVGLTPQDQVRVATALSEIGRELYSYAGRVAVAFLLERGRRPALVIEFGFVPLPGLPRPVDGEGAAARLVDVVEEDAMDDGRLLRLRKFVPPRIPNLAEAAIEALRAGLAHLRPVPALEELRTQNAELIEALEDARRQREELQALNTELEETNQGVMALYTELSEELETTNRGVVALHAELEEKSDQLYEASEAKNRFWANVSHELRTPANGIIGLARLLLDPAADPLTEEQRHQITLVCDTADAMLSLVNELLDIAKAEQGRLEPQPVPVAVPDLLGDVTEPLRPMAEQAGVALVVDASDAPPVLVTDEVMLTRILRNLLGNGLKFTDAGEVRLTVRPGPGEPEPGEPGNVEFVVSDTGAGIPPDEQERVFEEFYQVPGTGAAGTGLGLPYALRLARTLGGDLTLDSAQGEGTTVTLRTPRRCRPAEPGTPAEAGRRGGERRERERE